MPEAIGQACFFDKRLGREDYISIAATTGVPHGPARGLSQKINRGSGGTAGEGCHRRSVITASTPGQIPGDLGIAYRGFASSAARFGGRVAMALGRALWQPYSGLKDLSIYALS